jgi:hypothetical protein
MAKAMLVATDSARVRTVMSVVRKPENPHIGIVFKEPWKPRIVSGQRPHYFEKRY